MRNRQARPAEVAKVAGRSSSRFFPHQRLVEYSHYSTCPDWAFLHRRFGKTDNRAVILRASVFEGNGAPASFLLFRIIGRQVGNLLLPLLTKISRLKYDIRQKKSVFLSWGERMIGAFQLKRYFSPRAGPSPLPWPHGFTAFARASESQCEQCLHPVIQKRKAPGRRDC